MGPKRRGKTAQWPLANDGGKKKGRIMNPERKLPALLAGLAMVATCACSVSATGSDEGGPKTTPEAEQRAQSGYARNAFRKALPYLEEAATLFDLHDGLPESKWFGRDQVSNEAAINELIDSTIEVLGISEVGDYRGRIRQLEVRIEEANARMSEHREYQRRGRANRRS